MESDVREKILETARCIFLKEGYKGTTINSIARAAGDLPVHHLPALQWEKGSV